MTLTIRAGLLSGALQPAFMHLNSHALLNIFFLGITFLLGGRVFAQADSQNLYQYDNNSISRWSTPENINGTKGAGGKTNFGAKGRPARPIEAGDTLILLDIRDAGVVNRIWITINDRSVKTLRSLTLEMYWDGMKKPAVSVPLGDFFGMTFGRMTTFENALFTSPEGRSFNCVIPMPFKTGAKIQVVNESGKRLNSMYFEVNYQLTQKWDPSNLYFHAYWHRDTATQLAKDFEILPRINGRGRFLGVSAGVNANAAYGKLWWGEGEIKGFIDGDSEWPTLVGTGTEDYIGDAWGQGTFTNNYTGCTVADEKLLQWSFYRYHIPDPVFFRKSFRLVFPQMGSGRREEVIAAHNNSAPMIVTSGDDGRGNTTLVYKKNIPVKDIKEEYVLFYRTDDVCATAYFYLDQPVHALPALQSLLVRVYNMR